jgi:hypothetical protein
MRNTVISHKYVFHKCSDNVMINDFGLYLLSELPKMQNMRSFAVGLDTDIDEFVCNKMQLHDGTVIYCFYQELLTCLETLVAFSPYNKANDLRAAGPMGAY